VGDGEDPRGGLGHIGVESLKALTAATIIVLDRDQAALELVRGYGADHTVLAEGSEVDNQMQL
jgi:NAD+-dependent secondary alcohol dehydrogenase Adh1